MHIRNISWNLYGLGLPLLIAGATIPSLLARLGPERFGFLALAWGLIGYAGSLDLGVGRATNQLISAIRGSASDNQVSNVAATGITITSVIGTVGAMAIVIVSICGVTKFIHSETVSPQELEISLILVSLALPMQAMSATYRGINEAYLNFKGINTLRVLLGVANFGGPYLISLYTSNLCWLVTTLLVSRGFALVVYRHLAWNCIVNAGHSRTGISNRLIASKLMRFGGWVAVSSIASPILVQADRFFLGVLISAAAITSYVIPYEMVVQILIVVGAVTSVAFPLVTYLVHNNAEEASRVFRSWLLKLSIGMLVLMSCYAYFFQQILRIWIGEELTSESVRVGQILCLGVFFNAIGSMYFCLLHAHGKSKSTAILHLVELPIYLPCLYFFIENYGIVGAACAWVLRMFLDAVALVVISHYLKVKQRGLAMGQGQL